MCGRLANDLPPELIQRIFSTSNKLPNLRPSWNVAPTMDVPVVRLHPETRERHLDLLRWGLVPFNTSDLKSARKPINARSETVATSPMFRAAFARRRCLVPAAAFYEWKATPAGKEPFAITRADGDPLAFAGIWEGWRAPDGEVLRTFAILTTAANRQMSALHDRMPVILERETWPVWVGEQDGDPTRLLRPADGGLLRIWPVSKAVGNVRNDTPDLLKPHRPPDHVDGRFPPGANPE
jgi:putative SOS response-associated peptidase YedK